MKVRHVRRVFTGLFFSAAFAVPVLGIDTHGARISNPGVQKMVALPSGVYEPGREMLSTIETAALVLQANGIKVV